MAELVPGVTPAGEGQDGVAWNVLGHRYWLKAEGDGLFFFETLDPPGTFVPPHVHPTQDEFIYVLEGTFDLRLGDAERQARAGGPARRLRALFDRLHGLTDVGEVVRISREPEVDFLPPQG